jgi:hypothetical protein
MGQKKLPGQFYLHNKASILRRELHSSGLYAARSGGFLTLEDGTNSLSQNTGKELPLPAV